jgi:2-oxoglutarate ferredoxin oxidoreductase subunit delta
VKAFPYEVNEGKAVFNIFPGLCKGCGLCKEKCPEHALSWSDRLGVYGTPTVMPDPGLCKGCRTCEVVCPDCAILVTRRGRDNAVSGRQAPGPDRSLHAL